MGNTFTRGKPENKLLLLWRLGVPTLTAPTPAYLRAMGRAGLDMTCDSLAQWHEKLERFAAFPAERARASELGLRVTSTQYSSDEMLRRWDCVIASLWKSPSP